MAKNLGGMGGEVEKMLSRARGTSEKVPKNEEVECGGALVEAVEPTAEESLGD